MMFYSKKSFLVAFFIILSFLVQSSLIEQTNLIKKENNSTFKSSKFATDGGDSFLTAVELTVGSFSDNFTIGEFDEYFKINIDAEMDIIIDVLGVCDYLYFYNSAEELLEIDPYENSSIRLTITQTGYYYIRLNRDDSLPGVFTLTVSTIITGSVFYADGGIDFASAQEIPLGETHNRLTSSDSDHYPEYDYFKIFLNASELVSIELTCEASDYWDRYFLYIYDDSEERIIYESSHISNPAELIITCDISSYYYIRISTSGDYSGYDYNLTINYTFYPSEPSNISATINENSITISWTDSIEEDLNYLIYMDTEPINDIDTIMLNHKLNFRIASSNLIKIGEVTSGIEHFNYENPDSGTYYFTVVAQNAEGLQSSITIGKSSTASGIKFGSSSSSLFFNLIPSSLIFVIPLAIILSLIIIVTWFQFKKYKLKIKNKNN